MVTGASGALGGAITRALVSQHGAVVGAVSCTRPAAACDSPAAAAAATASNMPGRAVGFHCDIRDPHACQALFEQVKSTLGPVSLVVHCAGSTLNKLFLRSTAEDYRAVFDTNVLGAMNVTQAALRYGGLRDVDRRANNTAASATRIGMDGGDDAQESEPCFKSVVLLGSVAGTRGSEGQVLYSAAKASLSGMVQSLTREYAGKGIRFNVVAPGLIEGTDMFAALSPAQQDAWRRQSALRRCASVEEVAGAVLHTGLASYINGQTITVDGGLC